LLNNPINPEFEIRAGHRAIASFAIFAALLLHVLLVWLLFQKTMVVAAPRPISVFLVRQQTPKVPKPAVIHVPIPKPVVRAPVPVVIRTKPQSRPQQHETVRRLSIPQPQSPPVMHFNSNSDGGLGLDLAAPATGSSNGQALLGGFDDAVKQRIEAAKTYPPGLPPAYGETFWNECVVSYRVTVDRNGQLLNYKLFGCDNPFLDSAARAAILMAAPFPVPPNFGGNRFDVYGSLIFKTQ
jgi:outer membrane biosynthesis protein TonB